MVREAELHDHNRIIPGGWTVALGTVHFAGGMRGTCQHLRQADDVFELSFFGSDRTTSEARRKIRQPCRGMIHEPCLCLPVSAGNRGDRDQEHRTAECKLAGSSRQEESSSNAHHR